MDSFGLTMILSVMVYLGTGWYAGRKVRHLDDYFVAGRNAPTLLILGTLIARDHATGEMQSFRIPRITGVSPAK